MVKEKKSIPFDFAIENLYPLNPFVRPMFGAHAIYIGPKMVLILRDKNDEDSGVWIATSQEHHASLKKIFPDMRSIMLFGGKISAWQLLPKESDDFESSVNRACDLVLKHDERIGKVPAPKKKSAKPKAASNAKPTKKSAKKVVKDGMKRTMVLKKKKK